MIPLAKPVVHERECDAVLAVLKSGQLVQGPHVLEFERRIAERCQREHAVAVSSGTAALQLAYRALDIGEGSRVLCPALTWPSPVHALLVCGARPVLIDVDRQEWNGALSAYGAARDTDGKSKPAAAIVIDQFGNPARKQEILHALDGVPIIEDAACAIGSRFADGTPCGSLGVISCLSFHPRKVLTTGEGGMCLTDSADIAERLRRLRNHGQSSQPRAGAPSGEEPWRVGNFMEAAANFRLTDFAAAMGVAQIERLEDIVAARVAIWNRYRESLPKLVFQKVPPSAANNAQTCGVLAPEHWGSEQRNRLVATLRTRGVQSGILSYAAHRLRSVPSVAGTALPNSEAIADRGFALPLYPELSESDQQQVIDAVQQTLLEIDP